MGISWPLHSDGLILAAARPGIMMTPWPTKEAGPAEPVLDHHGRGPQVLLPIRRLTALRGSGSLLSRPPPGTVVLLLSQQPPSDLVNLGSHQTPWLGGQVALEFVPQIVPRDCGQWRQGLCTDLYKNADSRRQFQSSGKTKGERELRAGQMEIVILFTHGGLGGLKRGCSFRA